MSSSKNECEIVLSEEVQIVQMYCAIEPLDQEESNLLEMMDKCLMDDTDEDVSVNWKMALSYHDIEERIGFNFAVNKEHDEKTLHEIFKHLVHRVNRVSDGDQYHFQDGQEVLIEHDEVMVPASQLVAVMDDTENGEPEHHLVLNTLFGNFGVDQLTTWELMDDKLVEWGVICFLWNFKGDE